MVSDKLSLLAAYLKEKGVFRCPGTKISEHRHDGIATTQLWMNGYVGWNLASWRYSQRTALRGLPQKRQSSRLAHLLFGKIHWDSLCRPMFGVNMDAQTITLSGQLSRAVSNFAFVMATQSRH
jgi:hypothetical protein